MANGTKQIVIDWEKFESLCRMQCTQREIADAFDCSEDTIQRRVKEHYGSGFAETFKRKRQGGLISLRQNMLNMAKKHPNMAIFLAKNWLGMTDKTEITGAEGSPLAISITVGTEAAKKLTEAIIEGEGT